jgi:hypothetical protein
VKIKKYDHSQEKRHWEKEYKGTPVGNQKKSGIRAFDPMKSKDRPHTHEKVNETDH